MKYIELQQKATLTLWETVKAKRNINNIINFVADDDLFVTENDVLFVAPSGANVSTYEVAEILEKRPATVKGMYFYKAVSIWNETPTATILNASDLVTKSSTLAKMTKILDNEN